MRQAHTVDAGVSHLGALPGKAVDTRRGPGGGSGGRFKLKKKSSVRPMAPVQVCSCGPRTAVRLRFWGVGPVWKCRPLEHTLSPERLVFFSRVALFSAQMWLWMGLSCTLHHGHSESRVAIFGGYVCVCVCTGGPRGGREHNP